MARGIATSTLAIGILVTAAMHPVKIVTAIKLIIVANQFTVLNGKSCYGLVTTLTIMMQQEPLRSPQKQLPQGSYAEMGASYERSQH